MRQIEWQLKCVNCARTSQFHLYMVTENLWDSPQYESGLLYLKTDSCIKYMIRQVTVAVSPNTFFSKTYGPKPTFRITFLALEQSQQDFQKTYITILYTTFCHLFVPFCIRNVPWLYSLSVFADSFVAAVSGLSVPVPTILGHWDFGRWLSQIHTPPFPVEFPALNSKERKHKRNIKLSRWGLQTSF